MAALIEVGVGLRGLKADAVGKFIAAPVLARLIDMIVYPGIGRNKIQDLMGILRALPQVLCHGADILHHSLRIGKHIAVDALENIGVPVVRLDLIGAVDVAVAVFLAGDRSAADGEGVMAGSTRCAVFKAVSSSRFSHAMPPYRRMGIRIAVLFSL